MKKKILKTKVRNSKLQNFKQAQVPSKQLKKIKGGFIATDDGAF